MSADVPVYVTNGRWGRKRARVELRDPQLHRPVRHVIGGSRYLQQWRAGRDVKPVRLLLGRVLEAAGFRVGMVSQPDWQSCEPWRQFGRPRLFFAISAGAPSPPSTATKVTSRGAGVEPREPSRRIPLTTISVAASIVTAGLPRLLGSHPTGIPRHMTASCFASNVSLDVEITTVR